MLLSSLQFFQLLWFLHWSARLDYMFKVGEKGKQFLINCPSGLVCVCVWKPLSHTVYFRLCRGVVSNDEVTTQRRRFIICVIWRRDAFVTYLHNLNCWTSCHHFVFYFQQAPFRFGLRLHEGNLGEQATARSIFIILKPNLSSVCTIWIDVKLRWRLISIFIMDNWATEAL